MLYDGSLKSSGHRQIAQFDQPDSACQSFPKEVGNDVAQDAQMHNLAATLARFFIAALLPSISYFTLLQQTRCLYTVANRKLSKARLCL